MNNAKKKRKTIEWKNKNNNNKKTRDLFMKIGHTKGTFQVKMTTIKDRNSKDLTEAEDIRKRQE